MLSTARGARQSHLGEERTAATADNAQMVSRKLEEEDAERQIREQP
jgi:hypothetical protein